MLGFNEQKEIFEAIGRLCERKVECLIAGGSAMLFYGFKRATKDVDMIFYTEQDRKYFEKVLLGINFRKFASESGKEGGHLPTRLEREEFIFDLFSEGIFMFKVSPGIKERVTEKIEFRNFIINVISPEDIILLKSVTDRKGDRLDAASIIEKINVKWDVIIKECLWQSENSYRPFGIHLFDFFEDLEDNFKAEIPKDVRKKVTEIMKKQLEKFSEQKDKDIT